MEIICLTVQQMSTHTHFVAFTNKATKKQDRRIGRVTGSAQIGAAFTNITTTISLDVLNGSHRYKHDKINAHAGGHNGMTNLQRTKTNAATRQQTHKPWLPMQGRGKEGAP